MDDLKPGLTRCGKTVGGSSAPLPQSATGIALPAPPQQQLFTFDEQKFLSAPLRIRSSGGEQPDWGVWPPSRRPACASQSPNLCTIPCCVCCRVCCRVCRDVLCSTRFSHAELPVPPSSGRAV